MVRIFMAVMDEEDLAFGDRSLLPMRASWREWAQRLINLIAALLRR
jgi:hypothetical protein